MLLSLVLLSPILSSKIIILDPGLKLHVLLMLGVETLTHSILEYKTVNCHQKIIKNWGVLHKFVCVTCQICQKTKMSKVTDCQPIVVTPVKNSALYLLFIISQQTTHH
jgi:hypothetical protein